MADHPFSSVQSKQYVEAKEEEHKEQARFWRDL
ncbi:hypothetical protein NB311A_04474 [Nitrobacter sp. Nb-311A]|nr:hypothetical protein NB311A_04474 [Nitrobacter sp. Nb-311A]